MRYCVIWELILSLFIKKRTARKRTEIIILEEKNQILNIGLILLKEPIKLVYEKIGLGVLLGLEDWRVDSFMTCLHFFYLKKNHWKTKYSISLPRIRPAESGFDEKNHISNRQFVQLICAWRLMDEDIEINLSTRESASFRDHLFRLGITSMSVGSNTSPGGHQNDNQELEQFEIDDTRHPSELKKVLNQNYYQVVWKDWDHSFS